MRDKTHTRPYFEPSFSHDPTSRTLLTLLRPQLLSSPNDPQRPKRRRSGGGGGRRATALPRLPSLDPFLYLQELTDLRVPEHAHVLSRPPKRLKKIGPGLLASLSLSLSLSVSLSLSLSLCAATAPLPTPTPAAANEQEATRAAGLPRHTHTPRFIVAPPLASLYLRITRPYFKQPHPDQRRERARARAQEEREKGETHTKHNRGMALRSSSAALRSAGGRPIGELWNGKIVTIVSRVRRLPHSSSPVEGAARALACGGRRHPLSSLEAHLFLPARALPTPPPLQSNPSPVPANALRARLRDGREGLAGPGQGASLPRLRQHRPCARAATAAARRS
jgi:hypothetical protein